MITRRKLYMLTSIKITAQSKDSCMFIQKNKIQKNKRPEIIVTTS